LCVRLCVGQVCGKNLRPTAQSACSPEFEFTVRRAESSPNQNPTGVVAAAGLE